jgi:hypothetical protein
VVEVGEKELIGREDSERMLGQSLPCKCKRRMAEKKLFLLEEKTRMFSKALGSSMLLIPKMNPVS